MRQLSVLGFSVLPPIIAFVSWSGKLIAELPEMDRILISLELEDVRQAEIAKITGLSEGNVRVRIHRIKALLTKKIKEYEE